MNLQRERNGSKVQMFNERGQSTMRKRNKGSIEDTQARCRSADTVRHGSGVCECGGVWLRLADSGNFGHCNAGKSESGRNGSWARPNPYTERSLGPKSGRRPVATLALPNTEANSQARLASANRKARKYKYASKSIHTKAKERIRGQKHAFQRAVDQISVRTSDSVEEEEDRACIQFVSENDKYGRDDVCLVSTRENGFSLPLRRPQRRTAEYPANKPAVRARSPLKKNKGTISNAKKKKKKCAGVNVDVVVPMKTAPVPIDIELTVDVEALPVRSHLPPENRWHEKKNPACSHRRSSPPRAICFPLCALNSPRIFSAAHALGGSSCAVASAVLEGRSARSSVPRVVSKVWRAVTAFWSNLQGVLRAERVGGGGKAQRRRAVHDEDASPVDLTTVLLRRLRSQRFGRHAGVVGSEAGGGGWYGCVSGRESIPRWLSLARIVDAGERSRSVGGEWFSCSKLRVFGVSACGVIMGKSCTLIGRKGGSVGSTAHGGMQASSRAVWWEEFDASTRVQHNKPQQRVAFQTNVASRSIEGQSCSIKFAHLHR
ncbi:hypothetical protein C8J57DRAFT_1470490 [Mycena rebaudengoi]|nr:hypothetical protein C8J57DRAFT_1470490 [Mycena rebaudengoi]